MPVGIAKITPSVPLLNRNGLEARRGTSTISTMKCAHITHLVCSGVDNHFGILSQELNPLIVRIRRTV